MDMNLSFKFWKMYVIIIYIIWILPMLSRVWICLYKMEMNSLLFEVSPKVCPFEANQEPNNGPICFGHSYFSFCKILFHDSIHDLVWSIQTSWFNMGQFKHQFKIDEVDYCYAYAWNVWWLYLCSILFLLQVKDIPCECKDIFHYWNEKKITYKKMSSISSSQRVSIKFWMCSPRCSQYHHTFI
jgi:hypothetical protein